MYTTGSVFGVLVLLSILHVAIRTVHTMSYAYLIVPFFVLYPSHCSHTHWGDSWFKKNGKIIIASLFEVRFDRILKEILDPTSKRAPWQQQLPRLLLLQPLAAR
jgi:hypothetical protein